MRKLRGIICQHYCFYETDFLKKISKALKKKETRKIENILENCCNLLSYSHSNVYMPTYSNRLKNIGQHLGFQWKEGIESGIDSIIWCHKWETTKDEEYKKKLKQYNRDDCYALFRVKKLISAMIAKNSGGISEHQDFDVIYCKDIKSSQPFKFLVGEYALSEIELIHKFSHFDYQRPRLDVSIVDS